MKTGRIHNIASRRGLQRGSVFVETALVFLAFVCMLLAAFDFAQYLFLHQAIQERARYAARWGAINGPTNTDAIKNMVLYYQSAAPPSGTSTYFNLNASNITVSTSDSGSSASARTSSPRRAIPTSG